MPKQQSNTGTGKRVYKKVSTGGSQFVDWKKTKLVEGVIKGFRKYVYKKKKRELMEVANEKTGEIVALGHYAALDNLFSMAKKGDAVRVKLMGRKKIKGQKNPMLLFDVEIAQ